MHLRVLPLALLALVVSADDFSTVLQRRLSFTTQLASVPNVPQLPTLVPQWLLSQKSDGTWPDVDYTAGCTAQQSNWPASVHWTRIVSLAAAHAGAIPGIPAGDPATLQKTLLAMGWWFQRDFTNAACLAPSMLPGCTCTDTGLWNKNWFANVILVPKLVGQACLLLGPSAITGPTLAKCSSITKRSWGTFTGTFSFLSGANILDIASIGVASGLIQNSVNLVAAAFGKVYGAIAVEPPGTDGIKADGSFVQHGILYNGNYGKDYLNDALQLVTESAGTTFAPPGTTPALQALTSLVDGGSWMMYRNTATGVLHWDFSVLGRFIAFATTDVFSTVATSSINVNITQISTLGGLLGTAGQDLDTFSRNVLNEGGTGVGGLPGKTGGSANDGGRQGNSMFWASDYMVHRTADVVTTLKMFSSRTMSTECIDGNNNPFGFHLSDGALRMYRSGAEYEDIAGAMDWNMIPGTTTDYAATPLTCATAGQTGTNPFVGGASDGARGVAAMRYVNPATGSLSFQKTWFFLDNGTQHVMLNSVASKTSAPLYSVLDQRVASSEGVWVDGVQVAFGTGVQNFTNPEALYAGGAAYIFEDNGSNTLSVTVATQKSSWGALGTSTAPSTPVTLFSAWLHHKDAGAAASAYTVLPGLASTNSVCGAVGATTLAPLANTPGISAVWDSNNAVAMATFWQGAQSFTVPGMLSITSSAPLMLIARLPGADASAWVLTYADPTQLLAGATLTLTWAGGSTPANWG